MASPALDQTRPAPEDAVTSADLIDAPTYLHLVYRPGVPIIAMTIEAGETVAPAVRSESGPVH